MAKTSKQYEITANKIANSFIQKLKILIKSKNLSNKEKIAREIADNMNHLIANIIWAHRYK